MSGAPFLGPEPPTLAGRVAGLQVVLPDLVACLGTAGLLTGLPVDDDGLVHLARAGDAAWSEHADVRVHRFVVEPDGWLADPDLAEPVAKVAMQHDGEVHFVKGPKQLRHDADRDDLCREQGWEVVVSTALDDAQPHRLVRRVAAACLRAAERLGSQVLPSHLS